MKQFGEQHHIGALAGGIGAGLARLGEVAAMSPTVGFNCAMAMRSIREVWLWVWIWVMGLVLPQVAALENQVFF